MLPFCFCPLGGLGSPAFPPPTPLPGAIDPELPLLLPMTPRPPPPGARPPPTGLGATKGGPCTSDPGPSPRIPPPIPTMPGAEPSRPPDDDEPPLRLFPQNAPMALEEELEEELEEGPLPMAPGMLLPMGPEAAAWA